MTTMEIALPTTGDSAQWSDSEKALVEAAGLVNKPRNGTATLAPRPVVESFLMQCRRTGLDPIARQIYCIQRAGKWQTQISIDGARLVAERSREYEGQTAPEWSDDGRTWFDAWIGSDEPEAHPRFARVGVYRRGFREALKVVARWESYAVYQDEWKHGEKTGNQVLSSMWAKMPDLMLAKVAEMLALRKAFPQDLSGLYSTEEMQQADRAAARPPAPTAVDAPAAVSASEPESPVLATQNWAARILDVNTVDELRDVHMDAEAAGELGRPLDPEHKRFLDEVVKHFELSTPPAGVVVGALIQAVKAAIQSRPVVDEVVDAVLVEDGEPVTEWATREPGSGGPELDPEA